MLRIKIFFGLAIILILLGGMGAFSISMMQQNARAFERVIAYNYDAIKATAQLQQYLSEMDSAFLPELTRAGKGEPEKTVTLQIDTKSLEHFRQRLSNTMAAIEYMADTQAEQSAAAALAERMELFLNNYDELVENRPTTSGEVGDLQIRIVESSRGVDQAAENVRAVHESSMNVAQIQAQRSSENSKRILTGMVAMATIIVALLWLQFGRSTVQSLVDLTESVREIKNHNFSLAIPVKSTDEIGELALAFNELAAELHIFRQESDERIRQLSLRSRAVISAFPYPVVLLDDEGNFSQLNPEAEALLEDLGIPDRLPRRVESMYQTARDNEENYQPTELSQSIMLKVHDQEVFYLPRIFRIRNDAGRVQGWAIVLIDVSRFRWLDDLKTDTLATISHVLKTPLTSIRLVLHMLLEQKIGPLNKRQEECIDSSRNECEVLLKTLEGLLELARTQAGGPQLTFSRLTPEKLVTESLSRFEKAAGEAHLGFSSTIDEDLPLVSADQKRIDQVLQNLFSNALKNSPESGAIQLRVHTHDPNYVRFSFEDEGDCISEEAQERIFDRFYDPNASNGDAVVELGLSISREIIHAHGGRMGLDVKQDQGNEFYFDLPAESEAVS